MKTLYCKKADLVVLSILGKKMYISDFHIYFSPNRDYTPSEVEMKIREEKNKILEKLEEKFKCHVAMTVKQYPVEKINVKEEKPDFIWTDSGIISAKEAVIIEF